MKEEKNNPPYYLYSIICAFIFSLILSIPFIGSTEIWYPLIAGFIIAFAAATFFGIPIQIFSPNIRWSKILFWTMLFCCVGFLISGFSLI
tara:strand:- start:3229 stop:3498 length:270 start_codon:yes stop_codon:yes gene_type:complete